MNEIKIEQVSDEDFYEEKFDFNSPEDVLISVIEDELSSTPGWKGFKIDECSVIGSANDHVTGAASYEVSYGGFLEYVIEGIIECPNKEGYYVVEGVTGYYSKGDGWMTDDDMEFYYVNVREATPEEIEMM